MPVELQDDLQANIVTVKVSGKLIKEDYEHFVPLLEKIISERGAIKMLFVMHDFHGWEMAALWEDSKFDMHHFKDILRLAMVGETAWEHGMAVFCSPFTKAKIKYFDHTKMDDAKQWLAEDAS